MFFLDVFLKQLDNSFELNFGFSNIYLFNHQIIFPSLSYTHLSKIPYEKMWVDDPHWLPLVLQGKYVTATFVFGKEQEIVEKKIEMD